MLEATAESRQLQAAQPRLLPIRLSGIGFADRGRVLLDAVDLDIPASTRTVILGHNGAGKSLLLRIINGLVAPTSGTITFAGAPAGSAVFDRQALVFQRPTLLRRSVADNIRFVLPRLPRSEQDARLASLLAETKLAHLAHQPARLLSGGEQQRLAMARARARDPLLLLLDEPTASLDPRSARGVEALIQLAHDDGAKIILVTHDIALARHLADEVVFLDDGRVSEITPAEEFFRAPRSAAARAYLQGRILV